MNVEHNGIDIEHIGLDIAFHHLDKTKPDLSNAVVQAYETNKEHAEIFIQSGTDTSYSSVEILDWFLIQTRTSLADHVPKNTLPSSAKPAFVTFPIRFKPGMFYMLTTAGNRDLSHLKLMCKVTFPTQTVDE